MFIALVAIISLIIGLIRGGSIKNLFTGGVKCWWLFLISMLMFIALQAGQYLQISLITNNAFWIMAIAYIILFASIFFNLDNVWMYLLLAGTLLNFVIIFTNQGKMPLSESAINIANLGEAYLTKFEATVKVASSDTFLSFLGGIIPIPLVSVLKQVISPGTVVMAIATFAILQNALIYTYIDESQYEKYLSSDNSNQDSTEDPVPAMPVLEGIQQARQTNSLEDIREQLEEFGYGPVEEDEVIPAREDTSPIEYEEYTDFADEDELSANAFDAPTEEVQEDIFEGPIEEEIEEAPVDDDFIANFEDEDNLDILDTFVEGDIDKIDQELNGHGINQPQEEQTLPYDDEEEFSFEDDEQPVEEAQEEIDNNEETQNEESNIFEDSDDVLQEEMDNLENTLNLLEDDFDAPLDTEEVEPEAEIMESEENVQPQEEAIEDTNDEDNLEEEIDDLYNSVFDDDTADTNDIEDDFNSAQDDDFEMPDLTELDMFDDNNNGDDVDNIAKAFDSLMSGNLETPSISVPPVTPVASANVEPNVNVDTPIPTDEVADAEEMIDSMNTITFTPVRERNQSFEDVLGDDEPIKTTPSEILEQIEEEQKSEEIDFKEYQQEPLTEDLDEIVRRVKKEEVAMTEKEPTVDVKDYDDIENDSNIKDIEDKSEKDINEEADKAFSSHIKQQEEPGGVNVDSPFMIVDGRIVENPNYKFRRGGQEEAEAREDIQDSSVYVMNSGSLSEIDNNQNLDRTSNEPVFEVTPKEEQIIEEITREVKEEIKNTSPLPIIEDVESMENVSEYENIDDDIDISAVDEVMNDEEDDIIIDKGKYNTANIKELRELAMDYDPSISAVNEIETEEVEETSVIEPEPIEEENPYEKVEMKIGDVEIKFWKKDNDKK